jgi:chromate transporter
VSALILAQSTDRTIVAVLLTAMVAVIASVSRTNPLWLLLAGGVLGFAGIV